MKAVFLIFIALFSFSIGDIDLEKRSILEDKVEILVPKEFRLMTAEEIKIKYPPTRPPKLVFTDTSLTTNLAFNLTDSRASREVIEQYKDALKQALSNAYSDAEWIDEGIKEINGKKAGYFKMISTAIDTKIYNHMFFTDVDGKLLICSFNCTIKNMERWKPVAEEIMNSLVVK